MSSVVKIDYFLNGEINVYYQYEGIPSKIFVRFDDLKSAALATGVGISAEKLKDSKHLRTFSSLEGKIFYENMFSTTATRAPKEVKIKSEISKNGEKEKKKKIMKEIVKSEKNIEKINEQDEEVENKERKSRRKIN